MVLKDVKGNIMAKNKLKQHEANKCISFFNEFFISLENQDSRVYFKTRKYR